MNGFPKIERDRALERITKHLEAAIGHLRYVAHDAQLFGIQLDLPAEKQLIEAINACARYHKQPESGAS